MSVHVKFGVIIVGDKTVEVAPWALRVRALRKQLDVTQPVFAGRVGKSVRQVKRYERGDQPPGEDAARKMAALAGGRARWQEFTVPPATRGVGLAELNRKLDRILELLGER